MGKLITSQRVARYCHTHFSSSPFLWNRKSLDPSYMWFSVSVVIFYFYSWPLNKEPRYQGTLLLFHAWVEWASVSSDPGTMTYDDVQSFPIFCMSLRGRRSWPWTLCAFSHFLIASLVLPLRPPLFLKYVGHILLPRTNTTRNNINKAKWETGSCL